MSRSIVAPRLAFATAKSHALVAGFAAVLGLLGFSAFYAYKVQSSLSDEALEIYHRHVAHDDALWQLRRSLWLGGNMARDYLIHPAPATQAAFEGTRAQLRETSRERLADIARLSRSPDDTVELGRRVDEFWKVVADIPKSAGSRAPAERYAYIQREVVPRRNAAGDLVREFAIVGQTSLRESELAFTQTRRVFARRLLVMLAFSMLAGVVVAVFSVTHATNLQKGLLEKYKEVEDARSELQQLSSRLMDVQEEERIRLSRELHDEIGQMVATARLEVTRAEAALGSVTDNARNHLERARRLMSDTVAAMRNICLLLRPTLLDDLGLSPALQWQVSEFTKRTGIMCEFTEDGELDGLPDAIKTCVYRVLQESLHNCEKHAAATAVAVRVRSEAQRLELRIEDNGRGFDANPASGDLRKARFGLLGMRERATTLEGALKVESALGAGTRIVLSLPATAPVEEVLRTEAHA